MKTVKGIYLNLNESDYCFNFKGLSFYFSSKMYMEKFKENVLYFVEQETIKFEVKYKMTINLDLYFMLVLYNRIEKRGFRVYDNINNKELSRKSVFITNIL